MLKFVLYLVLSPTKLRVGCPAFCVKQLIQHSCEDQYFLKPSEGLDVDFANVTNVPEQKVWQLIWMKVIIG